MDPNELIETVYRTLGLDPELRRGKSRLRDHVDARFLSAWFLQTRLSMTVGEISELLNRGQFAISEGIRKVGDLKLMDSKLSWKYSEVKRALDGKV